MLDKCFDEETFNNDSFSTMYLDLSLADNDEEWIKEIWAVWCEEFKDIADQNGNITIWVSW